MPFARGFKTRCENIARSTRVALERRPDDPLAATELANYLGVGIIGPEDIPGMPESVLRVLLEDEAADWSALTVDNDNRVVIIYNPTSSPGRYSSDISHELSHLILRHSPSTLMFAPGRQMDASFIRQPTGGRGCMAFRVSLAPTSCIAEDCSLGTEPERSSGTLQGE